MISETYIQERIDQLKRERDEYIVTVNQQIFAYNGAIGELMALLQPPDSPLVTLDELDELERENHHEN